MSVGADEAATDPFAADAAGRIVLPAFAEPHVHLDTALTARRASGSLVERSRRAALTLLRHGAIAVRGHVAVDDGRGIDAVRALAGLRGELAGITLQIVADVRAPGADVRALAREALAAGADVLGAATGLGEDPGRAYDELLEAADDAGVGLDLHVDGTPDAIALTLPLLLDRVEAGFPHPVAVGPLLALGSRSGSEQSRAAARLAAAGVGVVIAPSTQLRLRVNGAFVRRLLDAGVILAAGGDHVCDRAYPVGRLDPLETANLLTSAGGLAAHEALAAVSGSARRVLGLPTRGDEVVVIDACSADEAIAAMPVARVVSRDGQIVASTALEAWVAA